MKNPNLGKIATDKVSGFTGIITSAHDYVTGCTQYGLQPKVKEGETGTLPPVVFLDEARLEIGETVLPAQDVQGDENGCDHRPHPQK